MKYILQLSGELPKLAEQEVLALNPGKPKRLSNLLLLETKKTNFQTLAFTKKVCQHLFTCNINELNERFKSYPWQNIYKKSFAIRINNKKLKTKEIELAEIFWCKIKRPKVNLTKPGTQIEIFQIKKKIFCGLLIHENKDNFFVRQPENRPKNHPSTLKPKLAKALINLSGITKGKLLDPFCGTGGILIESALLNYKTIGYDLSEEMIKRAEQNLKYFKLKNVKLKVKDATTKLEKANLIVTDLPYGRSSSVFKKNIPNLYLDFLKQAELSTNNAVIIFPNTVRFKNILKKTKFKIKKIIKIKVHSSLTRNITILSK